MALGNQVSFIPPLPSVSPAFPPLCSSVHLPVKVLRSNIDLETVHGQLHAKKMATMRQAYSEEIKELQDWNGALEDTLSRLMSTGQFTGAFGDGVMINNSFVPQPLIQGLSSPNLKVLGQVASRTPSKSDGPRRGEREVGSIAAASQEERSVGELERELQDLSENFVKQMCILQEENNQLRAGASNAHAQPGWVANLNTEATPNQLEEPQSMSVGKVVSKLQKQVETLSSQVENLTAQLLQARNDLQNEECKKEMRRELEDRCTRQQQQQQQQEVMAISRIDEEVDEALWLLKELSLDRARHSLERARESTLVERLDNLNHVVRKPLALIPPIHLHDLAPPNNKSLLNAHHSTETVGADARSQKAFCVRECVRALSL